MAGGRRQEADVLKENFFVQSKPNFKNNCTKMRKKDQKSNKRCVITCKEYVKLVKLHDTFSNGIHIQDFARTRKMFQSRTTALLKHLEILEGDLPSPPVFAVVQLFVFIRGWSGGGLG